MIIKPINEVIAGDIIGEDVSHNGTLLIRKHTKLSKRMINVLKKFQIHSIKIVNTEKNYDNSDQVNNQSDQDTPKKVNDDHFNNHQLMDYFPDTSTSYTHQNSQSPSIYFTTYDNNNIIKKNNQENSQLTNKTKSRFLELLSLTAYEHRYGKLLNKKEDVHFLWGLFTSFQKYHQLINLLFSLQTWDRNTFIHSFDVFVIGALLAKDYDVKHIHNVALGYLMHDIGKLGVTQTLLHAKRKLTLNEFEAIKEHTIKGEGILLASEAESIARFARSHHERLDGSGYPDQLSKKNLSIEMRILHIVDVYSALTLKRSYKEEMPANQAIRILLRDQQQFDENIIHHFIRKLGIYPEGSTVVLSNDYKAKVIEVPKHLPQFPYVTIQPTNETIQLPVDFSITVSKLISFKPPSMNMIRTAFTNAVVEGRLDEARDQLDILCDGLKIEDIYTNILLPSYYKAESMYQLEQITPTEFQTSETLFTNILSKITDDSAIPSNYTTRLIIVIQKEKETTFPFQVFRKLLLLENVEPIIVNEYDQLIQLNTVLGQQDTPYACMIFYEQKNSDVMKRFTIPGINSRYLRWTEFQDFLKNISYSKGNALNLFHRLFV